jgi:hypothetical protein
VSLRDFDNVPAVALNWSPHLELLRQSAALEKLRVASNIHDAIASLQNGFVVAFLNETNLLVQSGSNSDHDYKLSGARRGLFQQQIAFALSDEFASSYHSSCSYCSYQTFTW